MKSKIILAILIFISFTLAAQEVRQINIPDMVKFAGTWVYEKDGVMMKIVLTAYKKEDRMPKETVSIDRVQGNYIYSKNGVELSNSYNQSRATGISLMAFADKSNNKVNFRFNDLLSRFIGVGTLEYKPGSPDELIWNMRQNEVHRIIIDGKETPISKTQVPYNLVLKRVK